MTLYEHRMTALDERLRRIRLEHAQRAARIIAAEAKRESREPRNDREAYKVLRGQVLPNGSL